MIKKKREDYQNVEGAGRPFEMNPRGPIEESDQERQRPVIIHLGELNGQDGNPRVPKNFHKKAGRVLCTFTEEYREGEEEEFDIE